MKVELSKEDLMLIDMLLSKEEGMTRIEIHHCFSRDYKNFLKGREKHISDLLAHIKDALAAIK